MPRVKNPLAIRDEIAHLDDPGSTRSMFLCVHVACNKEAGHPRGQCPNKPTGTFWIARLKLLLFTVSGVSIRREVKQTAGRRHSGHSSMKPGFRGCGVK